MRLHRQAARAAALLTALSALTACGSSHTHATAHTAKLLTGAGQSGPEVPSSCEGVVMKTFGRVIERVYREGLASERTIVAERLIGGSDALREAVEAHDAPAARAAAQSLIATGHLTNLLVNVAGATLIDVGGPAITPLRGTLLGSHGQAIGSYTTSVWSDRGFLAETGGAIQGFAALRKGGRSIGGSFSLAREPGAEAGTLSQGGVTYAYTSFPAQAYPTGTLRVYLLRSLSTTRRLCRGSAQATTLAVLHHIALQIYAEEHATPAQRQVLRVERNTAMLQAVASREPAAVQAAIKGLLNQHIVRLRVFGPGGELLSDVGGPYVLAPVPGVLRRDGRKIGSFLLSVQDDEGYEKLLKRLEGLSALVYYQGRIVKNSLGPVSFSEVPANGSFTYHGRPYQVFTVHPQAFPEGPLLVRVLVPEPYLSQPIS